MFLSDAQKSRPPKKPVFMRVCGSFPLLDNNGIYFDLLMWLDVARKACDLAVK